jgi:hypothetical protein
MSSERRQFSRVAFNAPALLISGDQRHEVKVLDLSLKGALVEVPAGWTAALKAPCVLNIRLTDIEGGISMAAEVAHVENAHVGLQCRSIDLDSVTHLRQLIEINLGDAALLERDLKSLISH